MVQVQSSSSDVFLVSQRYNQGQFGDEIVGEVLNNGTRSLGMFDFSIGASFYDSAGETGYLDSPGQDLGMNRTNYPDLLPYCSNIIMKNIL